MKIYLVFGILALLCITAEATAVSKTQVGKPKITCNFRGLVGEILCDMHCKSDGFKSGTCKAEGCSCTGIGPPQPKYICRFGGYFGDILCSIHCVLHTPPLKGRCKDKDTPEAICICEKDIE